MKKTENKLVNLNVEEMLKIRGGEEGNTHDIRPQDSDTASSTTSA